MEREADMSGNKDGVDKGRIAMEVYSGDGTEDQNNPIVGSHKEKKICIKFKRVVKRRSENVTLGGSSSVRGANSMIFHERDPSFELECRARNADGSVLGTTEDDPHRRIGDGSGWIAPVVKKKGNGNSTRNDGWGEWDA